MNSMASLVLQVNATSVNAATISLNQLANAGAQAQSATTNLTSATNSANSSILANQQAWFSNTAAINSSTQAMSHLANGFKSAFFGASIAVGLIELKNHFINLTESLIQTQVQVDKLRNSLNFAVGKSAAVGDLAFIKQSAQDMGLSFVTVTEQYVRLAAASRQTSLEGQKTKDIFTAVSQASTVLGLSADETTGALRAITQMISKNTVMSEELKGQLGERLPGAFQIAARAMGVTTQELNKMLETGKVLAEDFLPKFAAQLLKETAPDIEAASQSMQASLNRLETAWTLFKQAVVKSGLGQSMSNEISGLGNYLSTLSESMDQARASGSGLSGQLMTGLGTALARMPFDAVNTSANLLNGTLNLLSAGTLNLSTNVNILPQMFETSAYASSQLASRLKDAEKDLAQLQAKLAVTPDNIYLKSEAHQAWLLVQELRAAKTAQDALNNHSAPKSQSEGRIKAQNALSAQVEKDRAAVDELLTRLSGVPQGYITTMKQIAALHSSGALVGDEYARALDNAHKLLGKPTAEKISEATKALAFYNDLMDQSSGYTKTYAEDQNKLALAFKTGGIKSYEEYTVAVNKLLEKQPFMIALTKEQTEATEREHDATIAAGKAQAKHLETLQSDLDKLKTSTTQQQEHNDAIGLGKDAIAALEAARLTDQATTLEGIAIKTLDKNLDYAQYELYKSQAAELRNLAALKIAGANKQVAADAAQDMSKEQKKAAEESSKYWEDALMRAFESGKGFFQSLWDTIKNTLKTQVLKVLVSGVVGGGSSASFASEALGTGNALSSLTSLYSGVSNLVTIGTQVAAGTMSAANAIGTMVANSTGAGISGLLATNGAYGTAAGAAGSAGSMFAAAAPWLLGAAALYAIAQATKGETRAGGQYGYSMDGLSAYNPRRGTSVTANGVGATYLEGPSGGDPYADVASSAINATVGHINALFKGMGSTASITAFGAGYETSDRNRGGVFAGGTLSGGIAFGESGAGDNYVGTLYDSSKGFDHDAKSAITAFSLDLKQSTIEALQAATDIPQAIADMLKVDAKALTDEAATALLTSIDALVTDVGTLGAVLDQLPFADLRDLGFDASAGLIKAAGSLQNLTSSLGSFYDNFYTDQEKTANLTRNTSAAFASLGITMPAVSSSSRDWYRTLVETVMAQDMGVASNQALLNNVLSLQGAMNTLAPAFEDVEASVKKLVSGVSAKVSDSIYGMQYGMADNLGKYNMLDVRAATINDNMLASNDINAIAEMANTQIDLINQAWALLSEDQQRAKYLQFEEKLQKIDDFVSSKGADTVSLKAASDKATADTIATAVKDAVEKAMASSAAAMQAVADKTEKPIEVTSNVNLTVTAPVGSEVAINA